MNPHTNQPPSREFPSSENQSIENIRSLYSPFFPLDIVRDYVMMALNEAVEVNQVHNRDPIGGSNENLFLYVNDLRMHYFLNYIHQNFCFKIIIFK